jgi:guanylate kinase
MGSAKSKNRLIVVSAPSGTGKTTLCARLLREIPELMLSISTTTRAPRGAERDGVEYFFVTPEEFKAKVDADRFAEWAEVHGNFYGTSKDFVERAFAQGKSLLLDIDVQGADALKASYPAETVRIFLTPPSMEELERRLRARGTDSEESITKRLLGAAAEMAHQDHFDHVIVNDDLERAYFELTGIVLSAIRGVTVAGGKGGKK